MVATNSDAVILNLKNVCRLCGNKMELMWIFDTKFNFPQPMKSIVASVSTIEINKEDYISQKICSKCVANTIKFYQFRDECIRNDKVLREQFEELLKVEEFRISLGLPKDYKTTKLPKKEEKEKKPVPPEIVKPAPPEIAKPAEKLTTPKFEKPPVKVYTLHGSVKNLFQAYPQLRMPAITLNCDINPSVVMELDAVENYFKVRKLNMAMYVQQHKSVAVKSTSASTKLLSKTPFRLEKTISPIRRRSSSNSSSNNASKKSSDHESPTLSDELKIKRSRKRKRPFSPIIPPTSLKKSLVEDTVSLTSSLSPVPSNLSDDFSEVCGISKKSHELFVCKLCNSVHYYAGNLKKHLLKHLYCQFCKRKFKTIEIKEKHIESSCTFQKAMKSMTNLPDVRLTKVELDAKIRQKYSNALIGLPQHVKTNVIEIVSDVDDPGDRESKYDPGDKESESPVDNNAQKISSRIKIEISDGILNRIVEDNGNSSDVKLLKNLLSSYNKNIKNMSAFNRKTSSQTQTILPTNELIKSHRGDDDSSIEMQAILQQLYYYRIPVQIKYGTAMAASYKYECRNNDSREFEDWDDLIPIDVRNDSDQRTSNLQDYHIKSEELLIEDDINNQSSLPDEDIDDNVDDDDDEEFETYVDIDGIELVDAEIENNSETNIHLTEPVKINNDETDNGKVNDDNSGTINFAVPVIIKDDETDVEIGETDIMEIDESANSITYNHLIEPAQINPTDTIVNYDEQEDLDEEISEQTLNAVAQQLFTSTLKYTLKDSMCDIDRNSCDKDADDALKELSVPNKTFLNERTGMLNGVNGNVSDKNVNVIDDTKENGFKCEELHDTDFLIKENEDGLLNSSCVVTDRNGNEKKVEDEANPFGDPLFITEIPNKIEFNLDGGCDDSKSNLDDDCDDSKSNLDDDHDSNVQTEDNSIFAL